MYNNSTMLCLVQGIAGMNPERRKSYDKEKVFPVRKRHLVKARSTSTLLSHSAPGSPMAPLQGQSETQSVNCLNTIGNSSPYLLRQHQQQNHQQYNTATSLGIPQVASNITLSSLGTITSHNKLDSKYSRQNSNQSNPFESVASLASIRSISPNRKTTAKNEIPQKEKKRKEVSSSRVKKFHRHFQQVPKDENLINYFSCALVSDILLQGHLYITDNHFAFYSNVFGYVTKVVIPTSSVTKISKEKTAKIIPNAVGVATADERHVFGSFISRESAYRLMCSVCPPLLPIESPSLLPKVPADIEISEEFSIEDDSSCSISGNESPPQPIDTTTHMVAQSEGAAADSGQTLLRRSVASSVNVAGECNLRHSDIPLNAKNYCTNNHGIGSRSSTPTTQYTSHNMSSNMPVIVAANAWAGPEAIPINAALSNSVTAGGITIIATPILSSENVSSLTSTSSTSSSTSTTASSTSSPITVVQSPTMGAAAAASFKSFSQNALLRLKFPTEFYIVYLGVFLSVILALFSGFLLYRILDIEAKTSLYKSAVDFNWGSGNDADIFAEALRWQKELQTKSTEEAQSILNTNLEQIAKVRRSLETLSMLIHDRSTSASSSYDAGGAVNQNDSD